MIDVISVASVVSFGVRVLRIVSGGVRSEDVPVLLLSVGEGLELPVLDEFEFDGVDVLVGGVYEPPHPPHPPPHHPPPLPADEGE